MKRFFTLITRLLFFIFFPGLVFAQQKKDYSILLNTGKFIPVENGMTVLKSSEATVCSSVPRNLRTIVRVVLYW